MIKKRFENKIRRIFLKKKLSFQILNFVFIHFISKIIIFVNEIIKKGNKLVFLKDINYKFMILYYPKMVVYYILVQKIKL